MFSLLAISQVIILLFGVSSIWLVGRTESWRRWGFILGLAGQPFWYYVTLSTDQYGIFIMCLFYTVSWGQGVWNYWIKPNLKKKNEYNNNK